MAYNVTRRGWRIVNDVTVRDMDDRVYQCLLRIAEEEGISPDEAAHKLLRKAAELENDRALVEQAALSKRTSGVDEPGRARKKGPTADRGLDPALAAVFGTWTDAEADEFNSAIETMFETVDEHMWE